MNTLRASSLLLLLLILPGLRLVWTGEVVGIGDGDTITVLHNGNEKKIRFYGIDTPEKRQAFGKKAEQFTSEMVYGKTVKVDVRDVDRYGQYVALIEVDGRVLNEALIEKGYAWVYRKYCKADFCEDWLAIESLARSYKVGLWSEPSPIPPWDFRYNK